MTYIVTLTAAIFISCASTAYAASETVTINAIDANGVGKKIGTVRLSDTKAGLRITPQLTDLPPGDHGFHHVNLDCSPGNGPNGQPGAGMAAALCSAQWIQLRAQPCFLFSRTHQNTSRVLRPYANLCIGARRVAQLRNHIRSSAFDSSLLIDRTLLMKTERFAGNNEAREALVLSVTSVTAIMLTAYLILLILY